MFTTGRVTTEGAELYYEVRGQGQPLLMISGGGGDAGFYEFVAEILADEYQVITYDRRGNSRSTGGCPLDMAQAARDAVAVLRAAGHDSAFVFGNSGGAVIALEMAKSQPQALRAVVVHEPPVMTVLPDREKWLRFFDSLSRMRRWAGSTLTMLRFVSTLTIPARRGTPMPEGFGARMNGNNPFFLQHEMSAFVRYQPDIAQIKENGVKVIMAAGQISLDARAYYAVTAPILAERLGCPMAAFPGHHTSYLDRPAEWAAKLREVLLPYSEA